MAQARACARHDVYACVVDTDATQVFTCWSLPRARVERVANKGCSTWTSLAARFLCRTDAGRAMLGIAVGCLLLTFGVPLSVLTGMRVSGSSLYWSHYLGPVKYK